jgi:alpha-tubulin suppressor-like RCC1 family protein
VVRIFGRAPALALAANTGGVIKEHAPLKVTPASLRLPRGSKFIGGAVGKTHMLLVDNHGGVWGCGNNILGQIGLVG